jgi:hypothetical protein
MRFQFCGVFKLKGTLTLVAGSAVVEDSVVEVVEEHVDSALLLGRKRQITRDFLPHSRRQLFAVYAIDRFYHDYSAARPSTPSPLAISKPQSATHGYTALYGAAER